MLHIDPQIAHNEIFHGRNQHAACSPLDRLKDVGRALGDVKSGFSAEAVTFGRDGGEQCDDAWHIGWASWTNENARKHERQYDVHALGRRYIGRGPAGPEQMLTKALQGTHRPNLEGCNGTAFGAVPAEDGKITCAPQRDPSAHKILALPAAL